MKMKQLLKGRVDWLMGREGDSDVLEEKVMRKYQMYKNYKIVNIHFLHICMDVYLCMV